MLTSALQNAHSDKANIPMFYFYHMHSVLAWGWYRNIISFKDTYLVMGQINCYMKIIIEVKLIWNTVAIKSEFL